MSHEDKPANKYHVAFRWFESNWAVLIFAVLSYSLGIWRGFWRDEYITWETIRLSAGALWENRLASGHLPGYFLILSVWSKVFGESEIAMRAPSFLMMIAAVFAIGAFVKVVAGRRAATIAMWITIFHPLAIWCAQNARPYAPLPLFGALAGWSMISYFQTRKKSYLVILFFSVFLGVGLQAMFTLLVGIMVVYLLLCWKRKGYLVLYPAGMMIVAAFIQMIPLLFLAEKQTNYEAGMQKFPPFDRGVKGIARTFVGDYTEVTNNEFAWIFSLLLLLFAAYGCRKWLKDYKIKTDYSAPFTGTLILLLMIVPATVLTCAEGLDGKTVLGQYRYFSPMLPASICLGACAIIYYSEQIKKSKPKLSALPAIVFFLWMMPWSIAFWTMKGDGPSEFFEENPEHNVFVGDTIPARYHFRHDPEARFILLPREVDEDIIQGHFEAAGGGPFWFMIYNNKEDRLDPYFEELPSGWKQMNSAEKGDLRGLVLIRDAD